MTRVQNVVRKLAKVFVASIVGVGAVAVAQTFTSPVLAAAPSSMTITDVIRDDAGGTMSIYWSASDGMPTSMQVDMCNDSVTFNTVTNPIVVNYSSLCTQYTGGIAGWITDPSTQAWQSQWLYVYAINNDGNSRDYMSFRVSSMSRPLISGSATPYSNGCAITVTVAGFPAWAATSDATWGMTFWEDQAGGQGTGGAAGVVSISNGVATLKGFLNLSSWGANPPVGFTDGVSIQVDVYNTVTQVSTASLKSANVMCTQDASLPVVRSAAPVAQVTPTDQGFTIDWTLSSSGSHPVSKVWVTLFSGNATLQQTGLAPTTADIQDYCLNPVDYTDLSLGSTFNPYCQSPMAGNFETYAPFALSGRIVSSRIWDSQNNGYVQLVNGRDYWVGITLENYSPWGSNMSASSALFQITPGVFPTVTAVSPTSGSSAGGTAIAITGTNFANGSTVTVGGSACTNVSVVSATSITCTTPAGSAGTASVVVTSGGQSNAANTLFTFVTPAPTVTAVSPTSGSSAGGTAIAITGTNFANGSTVTVGGSACTNVSVVSATSITCTTPAGSAGTASVVVTSSGQSNAANTLFTYNAPTTTTTTPTTSSTTTPATTTAPSGPQNVTSSNQASLERTPGAATALVNGQPVAVAVETPADLPAAQVDPEDRTPAQVAALQTAADDLVSQLNQSAGGDSGLAVQDTPTGAAITGLLTTPVPIENTVLVEAANKSTLFAALNEDGSVTEVQPGAIIEVLGDGQVGVVASGLTPGESVEFVVMSTPTLLGTYTVASNGTIKAQASLPDGVGLGDHTLVVASPTVQASLGLKVSAKPSTLPATGISNGNNTLQIALWLIVGGSMVAYLRRRRLILN